MSDEPRIEFALEAGEDGNAHLYGPYREHDTDSLDCWCRPTLYRVPDCECEDGCWQCAPDEESTPLTRAEAEWESAPLLVVHNEVRP